MRPHRPAISLRTVLVLLTTMIAVVAVVLTTVAIVIVARGTIYEAHQNTLLDEFRDSTSALVTDISPDSPDETWEYYSSILPGHTAIIELGENRIVGELDREDIPDSLQVFSDASPSGALRYLRADLHGEEVFYVAVSWSDLEQFPDDTLAVVTAYSLEPQREQVVHLATTASLVGAGVLFLSATAGLLAGGALTRPMLRLADMARRIGRGESPDAQPSMFSDINQVSTTLHTSARSLSKTVAELQQREHQARRLVSDAAHELRTPLTSMTAVAEILDDLDSASDEETRTAASVTTRGLRRLTALVEDLLELSRLDARVAPVRPTMFRLDELLQDVIALADCRDEDITVIRADLSVHADPDRVRTILSNLVVNALRHGKPPVTITAASETTGVRVTVSDHGGGIPPTQRERVFERFVTLDPSRHRSDSNGMGLAIARDNARALDGDLVLLPSETGTVFELTLPQDTSPS